MRRPLLRRVWQGNQVEAMGHSFESSDIAVLVGVDAERFLKDRE